MRQKIHDWRMHLKPDKTLEDLAHMFNPVLRGWVNYYGRFYKSEMYSVLRHMNRALVRWARRKYKKLAIHQRRAEGWLGRIARREQKLFVQWQMGVLPGAGWWEPDEPRGSSPVLRETGGEIPPVYSPQDLLPKKKRCCKVIWGYEAVVDGSIGTRD